MPAAPRILFFPPFRLDLTAGQLWRGDAVVPLRPKTYAALCHLAARPGALVSKDELLAAVWPDVAVTDDAPRFAIRELRRALGDDPAAPRFVETVHGRGWRFLGSDRPGTAPRDARPDTGEPGAIVVGRDAELDTLDDWLARARHGERVVGLVAGDAGIGKTTLVDAFLARAAHGVAAARVECRELVGTGEPYQPLLEAVSLLAGGPAGREVTAALRAHAPSWLAQLPSLLEPDEATALRDWLTGSTGERMVREFVAWIDVVAGARPLLLVVEDVHWSDRATLDALVAVAHGRVAAPLLVVGTYRPVDVIVANHPLRGVRQDLVRRRLCRELVLATLPRSAVQAYLMARLGPGATSAPLVEFVHERSDGNPFFMTAVVDRLLAAGCVVRTGDGWVQDGGVPLAHVGIPETLREMVERQLEALDPATLDVLEAASVAGIEFAVAAAVAALDGADMETVEDACDRLVRQGRLLRFVGEQELPDGSTSARYAFRHALYRDVLYARLPPSRRQRLHQLVGEWLERSQRHGTEPIAAELGAHFERSRDRERAVRYLREAAAGAQRRFADREAIACIDRALVLLEGLPPSEERTQHELMLRMLLAPSLSVTVGYASPELERSSARVRELLPDLGETPGHLFAVMALYTFELMRGRLDAAAELGQRLHDLSASVGPGYRTIADMAQGIVYCYQGRARSGRPLLEAAAASEAVGVLPASFDPAVVALSNLADRCLVYLGHPQEATAYGRRTLERAAALGHPFTRAVAASTVARMYVLLRDPVQAAALAAEAIALASEHGYADIALRSTIILGWTRAVQEGADVVDELLPLLASYARRAGMVAVTSAHLTVVEAAVTVGRLDDALHLVVEAARLVEATGERMEEAEVHRWRGQVLLALRGREAHPEARAWFERALSVAEEQGARWFELRAAASLARLDGAARRRRLQEALAALDRPPETPPDCRDLRDARELLTTIA